MKSKKKMDAAALKDVNDRNKRLDARTLKLIGDTASEIHKKINKRVKPDMRFPIRSLGNVSYSEKKGYLEIGRQRKVRTLTVNTVKTFAQTLRMMSLSTWSWNIASPQFFDW